MEKLLKKKADREGNRIGLALILVGLLWGVPAIGQDYIRSIPDFTKVEHTIVREVNASTWLVYCYSPIQSGFSMQVNGNSTTSIVNIPEGLYINEFEIMDNYVYFCGHMFHNSQNHIGVIGRFNLATINITPTMEICMIGETRDVLKLEVYKCEMKPRIIAVGQMPDTVGTLIDLAYTETSSVNINMAVADTIGETFSDVAVSGNMIYVASINRKCILPHGRQWFFSRPTLLGVNPLTYFHTSHYAHSTVCLEPLIENVGGDNVVFASKTAILPVNFFYQYMTDYYVGGVAIGVSGASGADDATIDIKYNDFTQTLNVLTRRYPEWNYTNYLYSLNIPLSAGTVSALCYKGYLLHSLEYRHHDPFRFVASGLHEEYSELSMLHYIDSQTPTCGESEEKKMVEINFKPDGHLKVKPILNVSYIVFEQPVAISEAVILPICN